MILTNTKGEDMNWIALKLINFGLWLYETHLTEWDEQDKKDYARLKELHAKFLT